MSFSHYRPFIFVLTTLQYSRNPVLYKYPKITQFCLSSVPCFFDIFWSIKLKPQRCTSAIYIHSLCEVSNPRTETSYRSAADKVLHKYPKISQISLSSNPRNFDNSWSIKLKPRRCTSAIYSLPLWEGSEP